MVSFTVSESESSQGLDFAKKQLEKHGWSKGKGLGKNESGITSSIKVGVKKDTLGVGYDIGKEFTYHWWDHLFNKAASNIVVKQSESGIQVSKKDDSDADLSRPKKFWRVKGKELYYGRFVKASEDGEDAQESSTENNDVISKFSDEQLLKACGGRTAHKSARHGHKLSGKLKRIADQEDCSNFKTESRKGAYKDDDSPKAEDVTEKSRKKHKRRKKNVKKPESDVVEDPWDTRSDRRPCMNHVDDGSCLKVKQDSNGLLAEQQCPVSELILDEVENGGKRKRKKKDKKKRKIKESSYTKQYCDTSEKEVEVDDFNESQIVDDSGKTIQANSRKSKTNDKRRKKKAKRRKEK